MSGMASTRLRSRRRFLQAVFGGVAVLSAGRAATTLAEPTKAPNQGPGELKSSCDKHGGVYIESKKDDVQACFWPNKGKTVCKFNGTGCYNYDPPKATTGTTGPWADPFGSLNWPDLEVLATEAGSSAGGGDIIQDATAPAATSSAYRRKRRGKRGKRRRH
ncbi:MAG: hypothetical protein KC442_10310 [Thermomicrobiales bacterium]|nr:hypothetical protein [Thermomicrobiales bacterium]